MNDKLVPCGFGDGKASIAMVGKSKSPAALAALMPSAEIAAKVGVLLMDRADARIVRRKASDI